MVEISHNSMMFYDAQQEPVLSPCGAVGAVSMLPQEGRARALAFSPVLFCGWRIGWRFPLRFVRLRIRGAVDNRTQRHEVRRRLPVHELGILDLEPDRADELAGCIEPFSCFERADVT